MPRTITALAGEASNQAQFPVSLVYMAITGAYGPISMNDTDVTLYLNQTTNALATVAGAGRTAFAPYADFKVPVIEQSDQSVLAEVSLSVSNVREDWYAVLADNHYRDVQVDIWQANLSLPLGSPPDQLGAVGAVKVFTGRLDFITANHKTASIRILPHISPFQMQVPYTFFTSDEFPTMPVPGTKLTWGFTERTL